MSANDNGPERANAPTRHTDTPREGLPMIAVLDGTTEVSIMHSHYANGTVHARLLCVTEDAAYQRTVTIGAVTQQQGIGYVMALARLMGGAIVMDGADYMAIRDSLDNARRVA